MTYKFALPMLLFNSKMVKIHILHSNLKLCAFFILYESLTLMLYDLFVVGDRQRHDEQLFHLQQRILRF